MSNQGNKEEDEPKEDNLNTSYGLFGFYPKSLQFLANRKAFLIVFCATCVLQGTFHTYFVAVITTLEKLFNIPSQTVGTLMMATEIGQVSSALVLPYYAGQGHRPRWMGFGSALFAVATLLCASPHLIIPPNISEINPESSSQFCSSVTNETVCFSSQEESADLGAPYFLLFAIIFMSLLSIGFGQTAIYTLGIPYLDDNVANRDSPVYFSITIGVRIIGPVAGFILGSICTRFYIYPTSPPLDFGPSDPRWLGAWWLGMLLISFLLLITAFLMSAFPPRLKKQLQNRKMPKQKMRNFPIALKRLLTNKVLVLRTFSSVFHLLPISGLYTFLPKYLESQFRLAAFEANMVTGIAGILVMGFGIFGSGLFIRRREPDAKAVALWVALAALVYSLGMVGLSFLGCGGSEDFVLSGDFRKPSCTTDHCTSCTSKYSPVCGDNDLIYFSPCHAGCNSTLSNCACIVDKENNILPATQGLCKLDCPNFPLYLSLFMFIVLVHSTSEVGSMLLTLRCVEPRDKAMALGLIQCAIGLFGNVPCPVIYGWVVDRACVIWGGQEECGGEGGGGGGNCWVYDSYLFRIYFHGLTGLLMFIAFLIDMIIYFQASDIVFSDDPTPKDQQEVTIPMVEKNNSFSVENIKFIDED